MTLGSRAFDGSGEPRCDGSGERRFDGSGEPAGTVPTIVGERMIGAFRPLQIVSSYSHCHKVQRCLKEFFFLTRPITHLIMSR